MLLDEFHRNSIEISWNLVNIKLHVKTTVQMNNIEIGYN